jgi:L-ribulose-5-phosphate 3-epimerase
MALGNDGDAARWFDMVKAAGFDGVEPTFRPDASPQSTADPRASAEKLRKLAEKAGLAIPSMRGGPGFWPTFASADAGQRAAAVDFARKALEAVKVMGGDTLLIVPGKWENSQTYGEIWNHALATAKDVADAAKSAGIRVGLENVENQFLLSPREWRQFLDEVGSDWVRMYFDVGNVIYRGLGFPEQWLIELGRKYITRIHFKDATEDGRLTYLLEGDVNWPAVHSAMSQIQYDDWVGIELSLPKHHPAAMLEATCRNAHAILKSISR